LEEFVDQHDIGFGAALAPAIEREIRRSTILVVLTDEYSNRPWCRMEVALARQHGRPMVVIDATDHGGYRTVPFLASAPVVRFRPDRARARLEVGLRLLIETVRQRSFAARTADLARCFGTTVDWATLPGPPEPIGIALAQHQTIIYPDPPVGAAEAQVLAASRPGTRLTTPTMLFTKPSEKPDQTLTGVAVGISVSDPPAAVLAARGLAPEHVSRVFLELSRHVLAAGGTLLYGGIPKGYTTQLCSFVDAYRANSALRRSAVQNYMARSDYTNPAFQEGIEAARRVVEIDQVNAPEEWDLRNIGDAARYVLELTALRERLTDLETARVILGGATEIPEDRRGPGIIEEAWLSWRKGHPLFVAGGFGGAAEVVAAAVTGRLDAADLAPLDRYANMARQLAVSDRPETPATMLAELQAADHPLAGNHLTDAENDQLLRSTDADEIVALVLTGLHRHQHR
jgi:hypothetical protein